MIIDCYSLRTKNKHKIDAVLDVDDNDLFSKILELFTTYRLHMIEVIAEIDVNIPLWWRLQYDVAEHKFCLVREYTDRAYIPPITYFDFGQKALNLFANIDIHIVEQFIDLSNLLQKHDLSYYGGREVSEYVPKASEDTDYDSDELPF